MPPRNLGWYNLNCTRPYPLDDQATLVDVNGGRLGHNLIADLNLLIPRAAGQYIHVGGISLGSQLATITFVASENAFDTEDLTPVAAVTVVSPEKYVHYAVDPLYPGVGGWVVWGTAVEQDRLLVHKFSSGRQSLLLPRAARHYNEFPIATIGKLYGAPFAGLFALSGGTDIEIVKEYVTVEQDPDEHELVQGSENKRDAIVIRLKKTQDEGVTTLPGELTAAFAGQENLYNRFRGPCGKRPESNTCDNPEPIESINAVSPDCCGAITIRFTGCAKLTNVAQEVVLDDLGDEVLIDESCGVVVDCGLDLDDACPDDTLPSFDGTRRWEMDVLCMSESLSEAAALLDDTPEEDPGSETWEPTLPFIEDFYDPLDGAWEVTQGYWGSRVYTPDDVGGWGTGASMNGYFTGVVKTGRQCWGTWAENCFAVRNNMIWEGNVGTYWRKAFAILIPVVDDAGSNYPRFGLVFNHRETSVGSGIYEWWSVELARTRFYLIHFDGTAEHILWEGMGPAVEQNQDVLFGVSLFPHYYSQASGDPSGATLYAIGGDQTIGPIYLANFAPDTGNFGITAKNCHVAACNFAVYYAGSPGL